MNPQLDTPMNHEPSQPATGERKRRFPFILLILVVVFVAAGFFYVTALRAKAESEIVKMTSELAVPSVQVVKAAASSATGEIVLPGNVMPFADTPIFARTEGYVKRWLVDLGDTVKEGQLLVELEAPELDQQINQAKSAVIQAEAKASLAASSNKRWETLMSQNAVSQQETDEKASALATSQADLVSAQANLARLGQLKSFQKITAPFDGKITSRNVEVGDRITAAGGTSASQPELYRITQDQILRIYVSVPEAYAEQIHEDQVARVGLASVQGSDIEGKVVRTSGAINPQSRTMLTEVQVDNHQHRYLAGGYATVHFSLPASANPDVLPVNTLLFRPEGPVVGVAVDENGHETVQIRKVKLGRDLGSQIEIISGVTPTDRVILNPSDSLQDGDVVKVVESEKSR